MEVNIDMGAILKVRDADGTVHEIHALQGKSAYQYAVEGGYTGTETEFAAKLAQEKFANPNALTFAGAVTGSYDGSEAVTVEIPSGGGGNSWEQIIDFTLAEDVNELFVINDSYGNTFEYDELFAQIVFASSSNNTEEKSVELKWLFDKNTNKRSETVELPCGQRKTGTITHSILCAATNFPDGKNTFVYVSFQNSKLDNFTNNFNRLSGIRLWPYTQYIAAGTVIRMFGRNHK